jgi:hypothetical protein
MTLNNKKMHSYSEKCLKMKNKIKIFCIKGERNKILTRIALYRIKGKKMQKSLHPNSNYNTIIASKRNFSVQRYIITLEPL